MDFKNRKQHRKEGNQGWRTGRDADARREEVAKTHEEEEIHQSGDNKHRKNKYMLTVKASDYSGEAWIFAFDEQAEQILGNSADNLAEIKEQVIQG